jgi:hypothetical protein
MAMAQNKIVTLNGKKKVSNRTQARVKNHITTNDFFVVRTFLGDAVGCVLQVGTFSIIMRLFVGGRFRLFRIPFSIIFDVFPFPCGLLLSNKTQRS